MRIPGHLSLCPSGLSLSLFWRAPHKDAEAPALHFQCGWPRAPLGTVSTWSQRPRGCWHVTQACCSLAMWPWESPLSLASVCRLGKCRPWRGHTGDWGRPARVRAGGGPLSRPHSPSGVHILPLVTEREPPPYHTSQPLEGKDGPHGREGRPQHTAPPDWACRAGGAEPGQAPRDVPESI